MISLQATFKQKFLTGLIITVPVVMTIFLLVWAFRVVDGVLSPVLDYLVGYHVYGLGLVTSVIIILAVGFVSASVFGGRLLGYFDRLLKRIPIFKGVYAALSQITHAFSPDSAGAFKRFVMVEYPRKGVFVFGFLTKECLVKSPGDGPELPVRAVYIPTNNLYLGEIALFRDEDILYTDIPIEEGIRIILSGGIAMPDRLRGLRP